MQIEGNCAHYFIISQMFEFGVTNGRCGVPRRLPCSHLQDSEIYYPAAGSAAKGLINLSTIAPSKA